MARFELATARPPAACASKLRHIPFQFNRLVSMKMDAKPLRVPKSGPLGSWYPREVDAASGAVSP